jgi:hypothetical protein
LIEAVLARFVGGAERRRLDLRRLNSAAPKLDPFIDLVNQRWNEGVTSAAAIAAELRAHGFKGDAQTLRRYLS